MAPKKTVASKKKAEAVSRGETEKETIRSKEKGIVISEPEQAEAVHEVIVDTGKQGKTRSYYHRPAEILADLPNFSTGTDEDEIAIEKEQDGHLLTEKLAASVSILEDALKNVSMNSKTNKRPYKFSSRSGTGEADMTKKAEYEVQEPASPVAGEKASSSIPEKISEEEADEPEDEPRSVRQIGKEVPSILIENGLPGAGKKVTGELMVKYEEIRRDLRLIPLKELGSLGSLMTLKIIGQQGEKSFTPYQQLLIHLFRCYYKNFKSVAFVYSTLELIFVAYKVTEGVRVVCSEKIKEKVASLIQMGIINYFAWIAVFVFSKEHLQLDTFSEISLEEIPQDLPDQMNSLGSEIGTIFTAAGVITHYGVAMIQKVPTYLRYNPLLDRFMKTVCSGRAQASSFLFNIKPMEVNQEAIDLLPTDESERIDISDHEADSMSEDEKDSPKQEEAEMTSAELVYARRIEKHVKSTTKQLNDLVELVHELKESNKKLSEKVEKVVKDNTGVKASVSTLQSSVSSLMAQSAKRDLKDRQDYNKTFLPPPAEVGGKDESKSRDKKKTTGDRNDPKYLSSLLTTSKSVADAAEPSYKRAKKAVSELDYIKELVRKGKFPDLEHAVDRIKSLLEQEGKTKSAEKISVAYLKQAANRELLFNLLQGLKKN